MIENKRQLQVANTIKNALADVFIKEGRNFYGSAFVTIYDVKITADLHICRIFVSVYGENKEEVLQQIERSSYEIKRSLVKRIKNKLRTMPQLEFHLDNTLDNVFKMDNIFNDLDIKKSEEE